MKNFLSSLFFPFLSFQQNFQFQSKSTSTFTKSNKTLSIMSDNITPDAPSKITGNLKSVAGGLQETVGNLTGYSGIEKDGQTLKNQGDAEYKAAKAEGYVEGTQDRVSGKFDQVVGAVTGDSKQSLSGKAQLEKGHAQQKINEPST